MNRKTEWAFDSFGNKILEVISDHLVVYPNTTEGLVYLRDLTKPVEVKAYSMKGMLLRSIHPVEIYIDLSDLPPGIYLILVSEDNHPVYKTF